MIALGMDYREAFQYFRPGLSLDEERERRADAGQAETFGDGDLYWGAAKPDPAFFRALAEAAPCAPGAIAT